MSVEMTFIDTRSLTIGINIYSNCIDSWLLKESRWRKNITLTISKFYVLLNFFESCSWMGWLSNLRMHGKHVITVYCHVFTWATLACPASGYSPWSACQFRQTDLSKPLHWTIFYYIVSQTYVKNYTATMYNWLCSFWPLVCDIHNKHNKNLIHVSIHLIIIVSFLSYMI